MDIMSFLCCFFTVNTCTPYPPRTLKLSPFIHLHYPPPSPSFYVSRPSSQQVILSPPPVPQTHPPALTIPRSARSFRLYANYLINYSFRHKFSSEVRAAAQVGPAAPSEGLAEWGGAEVWWPVANPGKRRPSSCDVTECERNVASMDETNRLSEFIPGA